MNIVTMIIDLILPLEEKVKKALSFDLKNLILFSKADTFNGFSFAFPYKNQIIKTLIVEIKSRYNKKIVNILAKIFYDHLIDELSDLFLFKNFSKPILLPIPMTQKSLKERGWNQCLLICKELERIDKNNFFELKNNILLKVRETEDQVGKNREQRLKNLYKSFYVSNKKDIIGRNIIVIDDVLTTGSTFTEAKRALFEAGAKDVLCFAISH